MIRAFDLLAGKEDVVEVSKVYSESGFSRQRKVMALKRADELIAIVELNITDLGLNMSDLTNSIKVIAIKEELLTRDILRRILVTLAFRYYQSEAVPVLW